MRRRRAFSEPHLSQSATAHLSLPRRSQFASALRFFYCKPHKPIHCPPHLHLPALPARDRVGRDADHFRELRL
jgi:hypothetical protein